LSLARIAQLELETEVLASAGATAKGIS
jgi:hypothetical protein